MNTSKQGNTLKQDIIEQIKGLTNHSVEYQLKTDAVIEELEAFNIDDDADYAEELDYVFDRVREELLTEFTEKTVFERLALTLIMSAIYNVHQEKFGE